MIKIFLILSIFFLPRNNFQQEVDNLGFYSENYLLYNEEVDEILASRNSDIKLTVASINKILTIITALELINESLDTTLVVSANDLKAVESIASIANFYVGQKVTLEDVLYGILLPSGADATHIMSNYLCGSPICLVDQMNLLAKKIGMNNTNIVNVSGLDACNQYSTLEDVLTLIKYAKKNSDFLKIYTTEFYTTSDKTLTFNNKLLSQAKKGNSNVLGAKSGYTLSTQRALSSIAKINDANYIFITTRAPNQPGINLPTVDAISVYNYLEENYLFTKLFYQDYHIETLQIERFKYDLNLDNDIYALISKDFNLNDFRFEVINNKSKLPIKKDETIGNYSLMYNNQILETTDITLDYKVKRDFIDFILHYKYLFLLLITLALANIILRKRKIY